MLVKQLGGEATGASSFSISYVDRNESTFLLGLLKPVPCTHCPDFFKGCVGGPTLQETALMPDREFVDRHFDGTEGFLCGKLRNIIALSKAEEQELNNSFEENFNKRISVLTRKHDDKSKFVLIHDQDELNNIVKNMEHQMIEKLQHDIERINRHNNMVVTEMQQKLSHQNQIIQEMQETIKKLKQNRNENGSEK
ncbi:MAG: hypothetical protein PHF86_13350 [Candidatus Nanoarchaeia archaeon]|jgi:hypothetical protein|nr:hypothetical protein [Candidatus Nanoarchaeia archaeon]